jgi:hypothetical protein
MKIEDYFKYYIQGSDHYLIPKDVFNELFDEMVNWREESKELKEEKRKVRDYINKHCVNEKISKEVGYKCYTIADTNELEKIMKILGDKEN